MYSSSYVSYILFWFWGLVSLISRVRLRLPRVCDGFLCSLFLSGTVGNGVLVQLSILTMSHLPIPITQFFSVLRNDLILIRWLMVSKQERLFKFIGDPLLRAHPNWMWMAAAKLILGRSLRAVYWGTQMVLGYVGCLLILELEILLRQSYGVSLEGANGLE